MAFLNVCFWAAPLDFQFRREKKMYCIAMVLVHLRHSLFFFRLFFCLKKLSSFFTHVSFGCRSTRETTPCSLIRNSEMISTPGSTTKSKSSNSMTSRRRMEASVCRFIPSSLEMEEFFTAAEQHEQHTFREKYNFCPVNDCPLPGRYEWTMLDC